MRFDSRLGFVSLVAAKQPGSKKPLNVSLQMNSTSNFSVFQSLLETHSPTSIKAGSLITAKVSEVTKDGAYVSIAGLKVEGFVPAKELPPTGLTAGVEHDFLVLSVPVREDEHAQLSAKQANAWKEVGALLENQATEEVVIRKAAQNRATERCAGVVATIRGLRAFIPYSQLSTGGLPVDKLVHTTVKVKVITCDFNEGRIILSHRKAVEADRDAHLATLTPGTIVRGIVTNVVDYGAFVDIGSGVRGLVHVSELSSRRGQARELAKQGESVDVVVLSSDAQTGRVSLSIKKAKQAFFFNTLSKGAQLTGKVARVMEYGAFIELDECTDGLLHISHIPGGSRGLATLTPGLEVLVEVIEIDTDRMKIGLSLVA